MLVRLELHDVALALVHQREEPLAGFGSLQDSLQLRAFGLQLELTVDGSELCVVADLQHHRGDEQRRGEPPRRDERRREEQRGEERQRPQVHRSGCSEALGHGEVDDADQGDEQRESPPPGLRRASRHERHRGPQCEEQGDEDLVRVAGEHVAEAGQIHSALAQRLPVRPG